MLKTLVSDFDGVIVDAETQWCYIYGDWLKEIYYYDLNIQDYLVYVDSSGKRPFASLKQELGTNESIRKFKKQVVARFIGHTCTPPAVEDVTELVTAVKKEGLCLAVTTSAIRKEPQVHLERLQLLEYLGAFSTTGLGRHIKSAPDMFLETAELLGCSCAECLAMEDSRNGLIVASKAGMPCLIVLNKITESNDFTGCYRRVSSPKELKLKELIAGLRSS